MPGKRSDLPDMPISRTATSKFSQTYDSAWRYALLKTEGHLMGLYCGQHSIANYFVQEFTFADCHIHLSTITPHRARDTGQAPEIEIVCATMVSIEYEEVILVLTHDRWLI